MLEFKKLKLSDINDLRPFIMKGSSRICNNTVGGVFMWRDYFNMEYALYNETVIFKAQAKYHDITTVFSLPLGDDYEGGIEETARYCRDRNLPLAFYAVTNEDLGPLRSMFKEYTLHTNDDWSDYIYESAALTGLEGRKYSNKRNHVNQFKKTYDNYVFEEICEKNLPYVREFYDVLCSDMTFTSKTATEDHNKTIEVLENYNIYNLPGGLLQIDDNIVAFSIGEIKGDVLYVHVEKADMRFKGAYQVINNEFAKHFVSEEIKFINREEDDGDPGLRFSKHSYHPYEIALKYIYIVV